MQYLFSTFSGCLANSLTLWLLFGVYASRPAYAQDASNLIVLSGAALQANLADTTQKELAFRIEGVVLAAVPDVGILALEDRSGTVLLELPRLDSTVAPGAKIVVEARPPLLSRTRFGVRVEELPVVNSLGDILGEVRVAVHLPDRRRIDEIHVPSDQFGESVLGKSSGKSRQ